MSQPARRVSPAYRFVGGVIGAICLLITIFAWSNLEMMLALKDATLFAVMALLFMPIMSGLFLYAAILGRSPMPQDRQRGE
jgi:putative effector of murein hydrolase LrgA (UPF0299 family)